uniref:Uncharacterized protein n=1 Tax=Heterorhabditis bacteriophora TaxID=37862 RepID=A0A1I7X7W3_HETBA
MKHFEAFPISRPIVCHAEKQTLAAVFVRLKCLWLIIFTVVMLLRVCP